MIPNAPPCADWPPRFGVGVVCLEIADERLCELPGAEEIFKAGDEECAALLAELTPVRLASSRLKALETDTGKPWAGNSAPCSTGWPPAWNAAAWRNTNSGFPVIEYGREILDRTCVLN